MHPDDYDSWKMTQPEHRTLLFVYGTLRREYANRWAQRLWSQGADLGRATMPGRLYSLGPYPGFKDGADGVVHGQVVEVAHESTLAGLDEYEGEDYVRQKRTARLSNGQIVAAWVYIYQPEVPETQRVVSGEFPSGQ